MPLIIRAIITGFGYKLGAELGRYVATRVGLVDKQTAKAEEAEEDLPDGLPVTPPDGQSDDSPEADNRQASDDD